MLAHERSSDDKEQFESPPASAFDPDSAPYCEITNRIVVISPRPASLRALVADLAARCYDVLLLHHADDPLLALVKGHIILLDRTGDPHPDAASPLPGDGSSPVLALVAEGRTAAAGEASIEWPAPIERLIDRIQELGTSRPLPLAEPNTFVFKDVVVDTGRMSVTRGGAKVELTKTEYDLLRTIMAAHGKVLTRDELLARVWGPSYFGGSNSVDVHIRGLRSKLEDDPRNPRYIATVRGAGYRLADN